MKRNCRFIKILYLKHNKLNFKIKEVLEKIKKFLSKIKTA